VQVKHSEVVRAIQNAPGSQLELQFCQRASFDQAAISYLVTQIQCDLIIVPGLKKDEAVKAIIQGHLGTKRKLCIKTSRGLEVGRFASMFCNLLQSIAIVSTH
jgi:hypothetical protein